MSTVSVASRQSFGSDPFRGPYMSQKRAVMFLKKGSNAAVADSLGCDVEQTLLPTFL